MSVGHKNIFAVKSGNDSVYRVDQKRDYRYGNKKAKLKKKVTKRNKTVFALKCTQSILRKRVFFLLFWGEDCDSTRRRFISFFFLSKCSIELPF